MGEQGHETSFQHDRSQNVVEHDNVIACNCVSALLGTSVIRSDSAQEQRRIIAGADVVVSIGGESAYDETMSVPNPRDRSDLMGGSMVAVATTRLAAASPIVPLLVHQMYIIIVFVAFTILVSGMLVVLFVTVALFFLAKGELGVAPSCSSRTYRHHVAN